MNALQPFQNWLGHFSCGAALASLWLPRAASSIAARVDWLFYYIYWISLFFLLLVVGLIIFFCIRYRQRSYVQEVSTVTHNTPLEIAWTVIPFILAMSMFVMGFKEYMNMDTPPVGAYNIDVQAKQWAWTFTYPNGAVTGSLHVPIGVPIRVTMRSADVIHGFYIPAFRVQRDVVPGRVNITWFKATRAGHYWLACTQYCGNGHSSMHAPVVVESQEKFAKWVKAAANIFIDPKTKKPLPLAVVGKRIYQIQGCVGCHSTNGAKGIGPTWQNLAGSKVPLANGPTQYANYNYLKECVLYPGKQDVRGFAPNVMPDFFSYFNKAKTKHRRLHAVIWYINMQSKLHNKATEPPVPNIPVGGEKKASSAAGGHPVVTPKKP